MTAEAILKNDAGVVDGVAAAARASGEVIQLADGRAAVVKGLNARAIGDQVAFEARGVFEVLKTASINILAGGRVYWDRSASTATFKAGSGDFYMGVAVEDSLAAATTVKVDLNAKQENLIDFDGNPSQMLWTSEATDGVGVTAATLATRTMLSFDAVAEVAQAAFFPTNAADHVPVADLGVLEMKVAVFEIGDDGSLDINFGLANGSHATDADSITESVFFHLDGNALAILAESDDGTTEVAATDTTVVAVDDTYFEVWIDFRNIDDIQLYIDGVNVLPASVFKLDAATGPMFPLIHCEKTSNDVLVDLRVEFIRMRSTDLAV